MDDWLSLKACERASKLPVAKGSKCGNKNIHGRLRLWSENSYAISVSH